jgi:mono/diheme cytochrome c family protein
VLLAITTTGKVVLLLVAGTFIGFSLIASMVVPRRYPTFPGSRGALFIGVCVLLFAAQLGAVVWVTGTQEVVEAHAGETTPTETVPAETTTTATTTPATTTTTATTTTAEQGDAAAGKAVFASAGCASCHTLRDAGASGSVGPNLDDARPAYSLVIDRVTHGKGVMPSFGGQLSETEIQNVAKYVSTVAGS